MSKREELQAIFETICPNVYYQPPSSCRMTYPAIRYTKTSLLVNHADDMKYFNRTRYTITVISHSIDDPIVDKVLKLQYSSFDRHYISDNLHHYVISIYY